MEIGFSFWSFTPGPISRMAGAAERWGYDTIGIADRPGNAMEPWVALCVANLSSRHPSVSAAAIRSG